MRYRRPIILVVDILHVLNVYGDQDREAVANALGCDPGELNRLLVIGIREGLISTGGDDWAGEADRFGGYYTITPQGRERYSLILERYAQQLARPGLSVAERFLLAGGYQQPIGVEMELAALAADAGMAADTEVRERDRAQRLANAALGRWAQAALDGGASSQAQAAGLRSLDLATLEGLGYAAELAREEYAPSLTGPLREVVEHAARTAEAAWELRSVSDADAGGVSASRPFDASAAATVAEAAADTLRLAAGAGLVDLLGEARELAAEMRRPS